MTTTPEQPSNSGTGKVLLVVGGFLLAPSAIVMALVVGVVTVFFSFLGGSSPAEGAPCDSPIVATDGDNVTTAVKYLTSQGLNLPQAAGLVGNWQVESGPTVNPRAQNSIGYQGIAQWDPSGRWATENQFAATVAHLDKYDLRAELAYAAWELGLTPRAWAGHTSPYANVGATLKQATTPDAAATVIFAEYEIPGDGSLPTRQQYARAIATKFASGTTAITPVITTSTTGPTGGSSTPTAPAPVGACPPADPGSLNAFQQTVLRYAWPTHAPDGRLAQQPGYAAAVAAAEKSGQFYGHQANEVPAGRPEGDHCSAFVSLLITTSGWDKTYNFGGKQSAGAGFVPVQARWMQSHWQSLGAASQLNLGQLQPGDVGVSSSGSLIHIWVYVGSVPGFSGNFAEASYVYSGSLGFAPEARQSSGVLYASVGTAQYYRRKA